MQKAGTISGKADVVALKTIAGDYAPMVEDVFGEHAAPFFRYAAVACAGTPLGHRTLRSSLQSNPTQKTTLLVMGDLGRDVRSEKREDRFFESTVSTIKLFTEFFTDDTFPNAVICTSLDKVDREAGDAICERYSTVRKVKWSQDLTRIVMQPRDQTRFATVARLLKYAETGRLVFIAGRESIILDGARLMAEIAKNGRPDMEMHFIGCGDWYAKSGGKTRIDSCFGLNGPVQEYIDRLRLDPESALTPKDMLDHCLVSFAS